MALCSAVIVNGVDLQNYYSKEPDFQIGITEEACNYLIESSPDTKNMKFFPKSLMDANEELRIQARNNSQEHFRFPFNDAFMDVVIGRMAQNQQFCERVLDDAKFGDTVRDLLIGVVYDRLRRPTDAQL